MSLLSRFRLPSELIELLAAKEVVAVVGCGPSQAAGLPGWHELLVRLVAHCEQQDAKFEGKTELNQLLKDGCYAEVADACVRRIPRALYRDFLQRTFRPSNSCSTNLHRHICNLPFAGLITTNFDTLIEQEYARRSKPLSMPQVFTHSNVPLLAAMPHQKQFYILKAHGHVDDIDSIILTQADYRNAIHANLAYKSALSTLFATKTALFIGYGLRDPDFNLFLSEQVSVFRGYGRRHFAILSDPGTVRAESLRENYNINVVPYSSTKNHAELGLLLKSAVRRVGRIVPKVSSQTEGARARRAIGIKEIMEFERRTCSTLGGFIELERARLLQLHADSAQFSARDIDLLEKSIQAGEQMRTQIKIQQQRIIESQKNEGVGLLAAGMAHDIRNIIQVIEAGLENLQSVKGCVDEDPNLASISSACERAKALTKVLVDFSSIRQDELTFLDLNEVVTRSLSLVESANKTGIRINPLMQTALPLVLGNGADLERAVLNVIINATQAVPAQRGTINVGTSVESVEIDSSLLSKGLGIGEYVCVSVADNGKGIPYSLRERIFDPFFTTKASEGGSGLGLSSAQNTALRHNGLITADSEEGHGSIFRLYIPLAEIKIHDERSSAVEAGESGHGESVLVVDDDELILKAMTLSLERIGYKASPYSRPEEALEALQKTPGSYDVMLTDVFMPNMNGLQLANHARLVKPKLPIVLHTGYKFDRQLALNFGVTFLLSKPFGVRELAIAMKRALAAPALKTKVRSVKSHVVQGSAPSVTSSAS